MASASSGVAPVTGGAAISFKTDGAKVKPGLKGNLIVEEFVERTITPGNGGAPVKKRFSIGYLPAIPFEVEGQ